MNLRVCLVMSNLSDMEVELTQALEQLGMSYDGNTIAIWTAFYKKKNTRIRQEYNETHKNVLWRQMTEHLNALHEFTRKVPLLLIEYQAVSLALAEKTALEMYRAENDIDRQAELEEIE